MHTFLVQADRHANQFGNDFRKEYSTYIQLDQWIYRYLQCSTHSMYRLYKLNHNFNVIDTGTYNVGQSNCIQLTTAHVWVAVLDRAASHIVIIKFSLFDY